MKRINVLKKNMNYIFKYWQSCMGILTSILSIAFLLVTWDDFGIRKLYLKIGILVVVCLMLLLWSILWTCVLVRQKIVWQSSSGRIIVRYADLLKEGFDKKCRQERLYVIPVNSAFDTIVDGDISLCNKPLISPNSLHGKWIKKMIESGRDLGDIDEEIESSLKKQRRVPYKVLSKEEKERGKREIYDLGTISILKGIGRNTFLLLALTNFDENNNAHVSADKLEFVIKSLIDFYDYHGQGYELVIPLMGTNFSRVGLTHDDSLRVITSMFELYGDRIQGDVSVIIYKEDKDKVTIDI